MKAVKRIMIVLAIILLASGCSITVKNEGIEQGTKVCKANGGLKEMNFNYSLRVKAYCNNGAEFTIDNGSVK